VPNIEQNSMPNNSQSDTQPKLPLPGLRITPHNPLYDWSKGDALA
jgi:hypothetical protein